MKKINHISLVVALLMLSANEVLLPQSADNEWANMSIPNGRIIDMTCNSMGHIFVACDNGGLFRSTNSGKTWVQINKGMTSGYYSFISSIVVHENYLLAGTTDFEVFLSEDNGDNWINISKMQSYPSRICNLQVNREGHIFFTADEYGVFCLIRDSSDWKQLEVGDNKYVTSLIINSKGDLFAGIKGGSVFRSTDNGNSWTEHEIFKVGRFSETSISDLAVNSSDYLFAAGSDLGVFCSKDNGLTWKKDSIGLNVKPITSLCLDTDDNLFATTGLGIFFSSDNGSTWIKKNRKDIDLKLIKIVSSGDIIAGAPDGSVYLSKNNGEDFIPINSGLMNTKLKALAVDSKGNIFAGIVGKGVVRSEDNGYNWDEVNQGLSNYNITCLLVNSNDWIFAGTVSQLFSIYNWNVKVDYLQLPDLNNPPGGGLFCSTNRGESWTLVNKGLHYQNIQCLKMNSKGHIFAGTFMGGIYRSTNNGYEWIQLNTGRDHEIINSLEIDSNDIIYAGFAGVNPGIIKSVNNGETWEELPIEIPPNTIVTSLIAKVPFIFAGTSSGFFWSNDGGANWTEWLNDVITSMIVDKNGFLFVGTHNFGIFSNFNSKEFTQRLGGLGSVPTSCFTITDDGRILAGTWSNGVFKHIEPLNSK